MYFTFCILFTLFQHSCSIYNVAIAEAPVIITMDQDDMTAIENDPVIFNCKLSKPCKNVTWMRDGKPIQTTDRKYKISSDGTSCQLTLPKCDKTDSGKYTIKVNGTSSSRRLTVNGVFPLKYFSVICYCYKMYHLYLHP